MTLAEEDEYINMIKPGKFSDVLYRFMYSHTVTKATVSWVILITILPLIKTK